ncbi:MAG: FG-GAP repeat protein, partial [Nitrospirae bacterium]|nr:FG-GAP repeat protein [Nitrospirota bacterium]
YGYNALWHMSGDSVSSTEFLPTMSDTNWEIVGTGDFNGDGITDIIWRHKTSGQNVIWLMNGIYVTDMVMLPTISDMNWEIVAPK